MSMTTHGYNYDLAIREVGDQVTVTNDLGRTAMYGEIVLLDGMYGIVTEHDGIADNATGRIYVLQPDTPFQPHRLTRIAPLLPDSRFISRRAVRAQAGTLEEFRGRLRCNWYH